MEPEFSHVLELRDFAISVRTKGHGWITEPSKLCWTMPDPMLSNLAGLSWPNLKSEKFRYLEMDR